MNGDSEKQAAELIETLFNAAVSCPPAQRAAYLTEACGDNRELRQRVEALLSAHETCEGFLPEQPRFEAGGGVAAAADSLGSGVRITELSVTERAGDRIGRYKLLERIGEGGCGVVYVAEQEEPVRRRVALKVIKLGMDTKSVIARFEAERQALALMDHPNIAKVLDAGASETGRPYFVMELVRGVKITEYCDENKLSTPERLELFIKVCLAIQHAHQKGIIHRDIKPSNILVTVNDGVPVPKVIDFGIAKATAGPLTDKTIYTAFEQFLGTPAYMSPEQAVMTSVDIDTRSDIYSLGVLLYELLTGQTPFDTKALLAAGLDEMRRTIREKEPERPSTRLTRMAEIELTTTAKRRQSDPLRLPHLLCGDLDWIVMKALEKDRLRRYETANGLAADLKRFLAHEPVVARPPSAGYRMQKFVRRNRTLVTSGLIAAFILVLGTLASTWEAIRATLAGREQSRLREVAQQAERTATARLISGEVANAVHLMDAGNLLGALPWIAESIRLSQGNPVAEDAGRYRFEAAWRQSPHLNALALHQGRIYAGSFSPDGQRFVTASADHTARVWDARTGQPVFPPLVHSAEVRQAVFSPNGQRIATVARDATLWIWDAGTGQAICPPIQHELDIKGVAFSPDGERIATSSGVIGLRIDELQLRNSSDGHLVTVAGETEVASTTLGEVQLWDSSTGRALGAVRHRDVVRCAAFSPDSQRIVTACHDGSALVWDVQTFHVALPPLRHAAKVRSAKFSPDGRYIVTASEDHTARLWDARTGAPAGPPLPHAKTVFHATFSPDGKRVATTSEDQTARLWDAATSQPISPPLRHESDVRYAEFSADGRWLITSGSEKIVRVWETSDGSLRALLQHNGSGTFATVTADGRRLLTVSRDHLARVWDLLPLSSAGLTLPHGDNVFRAEFSRDGSLVLTSGFAYTARLWDAQSGRALGEFSTSRRGGGGGTFVAGFAPCGKRFITTAEFGASLFDAATAPPQCIQLTNTEMKTCMCFALFSPDARLLVTGSQKGTAQVWNAVDGQPIGLPIHHDLPISICAFSPDGHYLATGSSESQPETDRGEIRVWETQTARLLGIPIVIRGTVSDLRFDPTGRYLLSAATHPALEEREAQIWDWRTGRPVAPPMRHRDGVPHAEFSPDGRRVLTASFDSTAQIWDAETGQPLTPPLTHRRQVEDACFSPDGRLVATASSDQTARVWDAATGEPIMPPLKHGGTVRCVRFSADGKWLITGSEDKTARIWELVKTDKPVSDLLYLAALSSGRQIDATGKPVPVEPVQLETIWRMLRAKYPNDFSAAH